MGSREELKLHDMSDNKSASERSQYSNAKPNGCHVTIVQGFILVFLALTIAVLIGVITYFASPRGLTECVCTYPTEKPISEKQRWKQCLDLSASKNTCLSAPHCQGGGGGPMTTTMPPATAMPPTDVRLPLNVIPVHYELMLRPDIYTGDNTTFSFSGDVTITITCMKATDVITLHINKLEIQQSDVTLSGMGGSTAPSVTRWSNDTSRQFMKVHLNGMLTVNQNYNLAIKFKGPLKPDLVGLYWSSYKVNDTIRYLATTQMQPTDARKTFPCFDEPGVKATFGVTLQRQSHLKTLSNMDINKTDTMTDGWVADVYNPTVKMSTYLLAFIVCDFNYTMGYTNKGTMFRVWSRPEAVSQTDYALQKGIATIELFEDFFNISFPLPKQDMIAVPDFMAGAMENWGLIIYRETALLYDTMLSSAGNKQRVAEVVVHELAHQWFGNLVTPVWWDDLWLNEGFASYMEYVGMDVIEPAWDIKDQFVERDLHTVLLIDSLSTSHPIYVPVNHPDEINEIFDRISYLKGASIIRMMNFFLGEHTFTAGLTNYLNEYSYDNSDHADLWRELGKQADLDGKGINVPEVMNTWVQQMGYPLVTIERGSPKTTALVTQKHFLTDPTKAPSDKYPSPFNYMWEIPLTYAEETSSGMRWNDTSSLRWMSKSVSTFTITDLDASSGWVVGNIGQMGYYRVSYDIANWQALIQQLKDDHTKIPVKNRAQIIDDAITIGRSGQLDELIGLQATEYLNKERHYVPWKTAADAMGYYRKMLQFTEYYGAYKNYILNLSIPLFDEMGLDYNQGTEPHLEKYKRTLFTSLTCSSGYQKCRNDVSQLFALWMKDPTNDTIIKPDLKTTVYCNAISNGGVDEWNFLFAQYKQTNVAAEAARILQTITCSKEPWVLNRLLHYALDANAIRRQNALYVIRDISYNSVGKQLAWNFFRANWPTIKENWGGGAFQLSNTIAGMTSSFNTQFELDQLMEFKAQNPDLGSAQRAYEQAIESTETNINWLNTNGDKIGQWLMDKTKTM